VPTEKQRRDAARRHLERQLQRRQEREARRKRVTLIASVAGTLVIIGVVVVLVIVMGGGGKSQAAAGGGSSSSAAAPSSSATSPVPSPSTSASPAPQAKGPAVTFAGVTVKGARDLTGEPQVTSKPPKPPAKLEYKDLVVGKGKAATPSSTVSVQYVGVLYRNGTKFDASWDNPQSGGKPISFSLKGVVKGFTQGIGGTTGVPPMKVGGRRIIIMPASLGYGAQAQGSIPANSPLVFVVDLTKVS
jgi:hypothetical protein